MALHKYKCIRPFTDLRGQPVFAGDMLTINDQNVNDLDWWEATSGSEVYLVSGFDLAAYCDKLKDDTCKSFLSKSEISPAIKNWLSTLPKPGSY